MRKLLLSALCLAGFSQTVAAQSLYMPRDITRAFNKQTRSPDGKPGPK
jgi:hypothetical protein